MNTYQDVDQNAAILKTVTNYMEGWYEGDAERMAQALHPKLAKRKVHVDGASGEEQFWDLTADIMIQYTRDGMGKTPEHERVLTMTILDAYQNMATVKAVSAKYVDYIHLATWQGAWKIVNVIWADIR